jgi:hypothetical protein
MISLNKSKKIDFIQVVVFFAMLSEVVWLLLADLMFRVLASRQSDFLYQDSITNPS